MKRIGLIDNLTNIRSFLDDHFHDCSATDLMTATGGNTGNVAFVFGTRKLIRNNILRIGWGWNPEVVRDRVDQIVVSCANQIGAHADLAAWASRLEEFGLPVTLIGLGAQANDYNESVVFPDGTRRFLDVVAGLRPQTSKTNIGVRGAFTQRCLDEHGFQTATTGCPSLLISSARNLGIDVLSRQDTATYEQVAVSAGNPWHAPSAHIERTLVEIVDAYSGAYVLQHPESMLALAIGDRSQIKASTIARFLEVYQGRFNEETLLDWYKRKAIFFADVPNWMRFLRRFDATVGPRYHGVALAIQAGVPGCVFTIDSRTEELCEETAVKSIPANELKGLSASEILARSRWTDTDAETFDATRHKKAHFITEFLRNNEIEPSDHLLSLT